MNNLDNLIKNIYQEIEQSKIYDIVLRSPLDQAHKLSRSLKNTVLMKREDLQSIFSFKIRGAYNRIKTLSDSEKKRGVICASAGNHGQGVAFSARHFSIPATVVMPITTPLIKVNAVRQLGARVVQFGDSYSEAASYCQKLCEQTGQVFIHPFDDPSVIAGQGTIGKELIEDCERINIVFVPVGGGGLISGIACYLKTMNPSIKIIGVEPIESSAMMQSLAQAKRITLTETGSFADGVSVKEVGHLTYQITKHLVDEIITVSNDEICSAIENIYDETRTILEPSGALAMAGLKHYLAVHSEIEDQILVAISSGANMSFQRLQFVAEKALTSENREVLLAVKLEEKPGALLSFCKRMVAQRSITEFNYRYRDSQSAFIFVGIDNRDKLPSATICEEFGSKGYECIDLTNNELAKDHIRHMVGGVKEKEDKIVERVCRFQFPDRPGALFDFLSVFGTRWNITLFHHRSHGTDFNRVLIGFEIPLHEQSDFDVFLRRTKFPYSDEKENLAYQIFLAPTKTVSPEKKSLSKKYA